MQAVGFSLDRAAVVAGLDLGEDFLFYTNENAAAAFLDAPGCTAAARSEDDGTAVGATAAAAAAAAAETVSSHFGLPYPAATGVFFGTKTITLDGRSWGCGLDDIALEETAQWLEREPSDVDDCEDETEMRDIEEFLVSALSPEQEVEAGVKKAEDENVTVSAAEPEVDKEEQQHIRTHSHSQVHAQSCVGKSRKTKPGGGCQRHSSDASVLQELATVVSKLDSRSRLCIRDAFYRLAENASRRCGVHAEALDPEYLRPEASSNSIDRSVVSLLFRKDHPCPPPLPIPPPSPPLSPPPSASRAPPLPPSSIASSSRNEHQHRVYPNGKIPLPPVHKHRCAGSSSSSSSSSLLRTPTMRAATTAMPLPATKNKNLLLVPGSSSVNSKRRTAAAVASASNVFHKRGKYSLV